MYLCSLSFQVLVTDDNEYQEPSLEEGGRIVAHISDSPKPPPQRVTLTLPAVNAANCCVFAACGAGKADMMARLLAKEKEGLPAQLIMPK